MLEYNWLFCFVLYLSQDGPEQDGQHERGGGDAAAAGGTRRRGQHSSPLHGIK